MRVGQIEKNILYPQLGNSRFGNGRFAKQLTTWKAVSIEEFGKDWNQGCRIPDSTNEAGPGSNLGPASVLSLLFRS